MLRKLSQEVADCHRHAQDSRERAERTADDAEKLDYIKLELGWLTLAESYELVERLSNFSSEARKRAAAESFLFESRRPAVAPPCPGCGKEMRRIRTNRPGAAALFAQCRLVCEACDVTALQAGPAAED